jgi:hypothetical protein
MARQRRRIAFTKSAFESQRISMHFEGISTRLRNALAQRFDRT